MAYEIPGLAWTLPAAADLSASQYCFVDADNTAAGSRAALASNNGKAVGVLQNKPNAAGRGAGIMSTGISKVVCGASVTAGQEVQTNAAGKAITLVSGSYSLGRALASGANGEVIPVLLNIGNAKLP